MSGPSACACFPFTSLWQLNVQFKDGQAEMGIEAAQKLGICELRDGVEWRSRRYVFGITQFRGVLYVPSSDETVLVARTAKTELSIGFWQKSFLLRFASKVKSNVCIDPALGDKMVLYGGGSRVHQDDSGEPVLPVGTCGTPSERPHFGPMPNHRFRRECSPVLSESHRARTRHHFRKYVAARFFS